MNFESFVDNLDGAIFGQGDFLNDLLEAFQTEEENKIEQYNQLYTIAQKFKISTIPETSAEGLETFRRDCANKRNAKIRDLLDTMYNMIPSELLDKVVLTEEQNIQLAWIVAKFNEIYVGDDVIERRITDLWNILLT
jgi:hypothetical protein